MRTPAIRYLLNSVLAIMMMAVSAASIAQQQTTMQPVAQIQVQGMGSVAVTPDAFSVTFILEQKGETVSKLNTQLQNDLNQLTTFLMDQGVPAKHIQSMQIRLSPWYENSAQGRKQSGFVLSREVSVTHNQIDEYDRMIDGALKRGVTRISQFELVSQTQQDAYQQALINAISDAKSRAGVIAAELDVRVGSVISVTQQHGGMVFSSGAPRMAMADESAAMPGQQQIEANVNVIFALDEVKNGEQ